MRGGGLFGGADFEAVGAAGDREDFGVVQEGRRRSEQMPDIVTRKGAVYWRIRGSIRALC